MPKWDQKVILRTRQRVSATSYSIEKQLMRQRIKIIGRTVWHQLSEADAKIWSMKVHAAAH